MNLNVFCCVVPLDIWAYWRFRSWGSKSKQIEKVVGVVCKLSVYIYLHIRSAKNVSWEVEWTVPSKSAPRMFRMVYTAAFPWFSVTFACFFLVRNLSACLMSQFGRTGYDHWLWCFAGLRSELFGASESSLRLHIAVPDRNRSARVWLIL
jgi:hypothetical protein